MAAICLGLVNWAAAQQRPAYEQGVVPESGTFIAFKEHGGVSKLRLWGAYGFKPGEARHVQLGYFVQHQGIPKQFKKTVHEGVSQNTIAVMIKWRGSKNYVAINAETAVNLGILRIDASLNFVSADTLPENIKNSIEGYGVFLPINLVDSEKFASLTDEKERIEVIAWSLSASKIRAWPPRPSE